MRSHYTAALLFFLALNTSAQVVFDLPGALPSPGTSMEQGWDWDGTPITLATTGTNVNWDLTGVLTAGTTRTVIESLPAGTPGASDFPDATHAHGEVIGGFTIWYYYRLGAGDTLWLEGARYQDGEVFECSSPNLYMFFPYAIGDLAESNTSCTFDGGQPITVNQGLEAVATGTILYPGGSITDVVLLRAHYNGSPGEYYWYHSSNALGWIGTFDPGNSLTLWAELPTGIREGSSSAQVNPYPTPTHDAVFVKVPGNITDIQYHLIDASGRLIQRGTPEMDYGTLRIDVSKCPVGQYVMHLSGREFIRNAQISIVR